MLWRMPAGEKCLYLTFDDGPHPTITPQVLDILRRYDAKATFFCIGNNVRKYHETFELLRKEGHSVGCHTFNHENGWKTKDDDYVKSLTPEQVYNNVIFNAKDGSIIAFHDSEKAYQRMIEALPRVLEYFSRKGYKFKAIPENSD